MKYFESCFIGAGGAILAQAPWAEEEIDGLHCAMDFLSGVLASEKIVTSTYADYHQGRATRGIAYLPTTSYIEMNEWTLPVPMAHHYADLVQASKSSGSFEQNKAFLRGGIWKNFFMRYPESNWMHKRMLSLSRRLHALPQKKQTAVARIV